MKYERFEKIVLELQEQDKVLTQLNDHNDDVLGWQERGQINALMLLIQSKK